MANLTSELKELRRSIAGEVIVPNTALFDDLPRPFNARFHDVVPSAIVQCASPEDARQAIALIRRYRLESSVRSGGHCFAGRSSTPGIVVDVSPMRSVSIAGDIATVGAGARLGDVYEALEHRGLTIPAGTCPPVGIAGLALGGGLGILGRRYGVTSDHLVGAQIVLADGRILSVDEQHNGDLFWALRGAGAGTFGVVTSLSLRTVPAPTLTNVHLVWPFSQAEALVEAWQGWAPDAPDELAVSLKVTDSGADRLPRVDVYAAFQGSEKGAAELLQEFVARAGAAPSSSFSRRMSFAQSRRFWADLGVDEREDGRRSDPTAESPYLFARSEFFRRSMPAEAIGALIQTVLEGRTAGEARELDFMPWAGAYNRVPSEATAFVHRGERFVLKHAATTGGEASAAAKDAAQRWVTRSWTTVHPWASGRVFQNFPDPDLENWADAYYGENYDRLMSVKARYDPDDHFRFHQSIPARASHGEASAE